MIADHKVEAAADFREFFHTSMWSVPVSEMWLLTQALMKDPRSRLMASVAGWEYPTSREFMVLADLVDVQLASKSKHKPKPYGRPWDKKPNRLGSKPMSILELRTKLGAFDGASEDQVEIIERDSAGG